MKVNLGSPNIDWSLCIKFTAPLAFWLLWRLHPKRCNRRWIHSWWTVAAYQVKVNGTLTFLSDRLTGIGSDRAGGLAPFLVSSNKMLSWNMHLWHTDIYLLWACHCHSLAMWLHSSEFQFLRPWFEDYDLIEHGSTAVKIEIHLAKSPGLFFNT